MKENKIRATVSQKVQAYALMAVPEKSGLFGGTLLTCNASKYSSVCFVFLIEPFP
jgi:hypothetical protein